MVIKVTSSLSGEQISIPNLWETYNWEHANAFLHNVSKVESRQPSSVGYLKNKINSGWDYSRQFTRRSLLGVTKDGLPFGAATSLIHRSLHEALAANPRMFAVFAASKVEGYRDDLYAVHLGPRSHRPFNIGDVDLSPGIHGQGWASGPGISLLLGVDWQLLPPDPLDREYCYGEMLVESGRIGQALTMEAGSLGLRTRMTPAVKESYFSELLDLHDDQDILYFLKIASTVSHPGDR